MSMPGPPLGEFTLEQMRRAKAEFCHFQPADDVTLGVGDGLSVFARQRFGELVHVAVQQLDELHQNPGTLLRIGRGPVDLRFGRDCDGFGHFIVGGQRHLRLHFAGCRVHHVGKPARLALHMLAADVVGEFLHGPASGMITLRSSCTHRT
jgi:hypothetical protein